MLMHTRMGALFAGGPNVKINKRQHLNEFPYDFVFPCHAGPLFLYSELTGRKLLIWTLALCCKAFNWDVNVSEWRKGSLLCKTCIIIVFVGLFT